MKSSAWLAAALLLVGLVPSIATAGVVLSTSAVPRYAGGAVVCSAVNVGDVALDITLSVIDVSNGVEAQRKECTGDAAVAPSKRCKSDPDSGGAVLFCKATIDLKGAGATPNPATATLRQQVRVTIASANSDSSSFTVLPGE